jgi:hypothetical protein
MNGIKRLFIRLSMGWLACVQIMASYGILSKKDNFFANVCHEGFADLILV